MSAKFGPLDPRSKIPAWPLMAQLEQAAMPGSVAQMQQEQRMPATQAVTSPISGAQQAPQLTAVSYQNQFVSPEDLAKRQELMQKLSSLQESDMAAQTAGIQDYEKAMGDYQGQKLQYDVRPLAAVIDQIAGSNTYKLASDMLTDTPESKRQKLMQMKEKLQDVKRNMSKDQYTYMKGQLDEINELVKMEKQFKAMEAAAGRQQRFDEAQTLKKEDAIRKDVNKIADEFSNVQGQLNTAEQAVKSGDTREVAMIIASIARNVGEQKGALSDGDVARSFPPDVATSVSQLQAYLGSVEKISPELQGALSTLINRARQKSNMIYEESLGRRRSQYGAGAYSPLMQQNQVGDVIFKEAEALKPQSQQQVPPPQNDLMEAARKEIERRRQRQGQ
jgi:hypothetical protein